MLFMVHYEIQPQHRDVNYARVLALGGDGVPDEVKILGTWSSVTQLEGWVVVDTDDVHLLGKWMRHWTDLNMQRITPIIDAKTQHEIMTGVI